eukprot:4690541-Amphidinium_carterae.2
MEHLKATVATVCLCGCRAVVRYHTVDYVGPQVVHCHNPAHSDTGMIAVEMVSTSSDLSACGEPDM